MLPGPLDFGPQAGRVVIAWAEHGALVNRRVLRRGAAHDRCALSLTSLTSVLTFSTASVGIGGVPWRILFRPIADTIAATTSRATPMIRADSHACSEWLMAMITQAMRQATP